MIEGWENSVEVSVGPDRGELMEALSVVRELGGEDMYQRATGGSAEQATEVALGMVRMALANILDPARGSCAELEAAVVALAVGYPGVGSMSEVAKRHGLGRAAVSKRVAVFAEQCGLPPSVYMRSEAVRGKYRAANVRKCKRSSR